MKSYLNYSCEDSQYSYYSQGIALPALFLWIFIIPGYFFIVIFLKKNKLEDIAIMRKYGYLYIDYKVYYWEFIRMYEKTLIIIFLEFFETKQIFKSLLILLILAIYYMLLVKFRPYKINKLNSLEKKTIIVCFSSLFFGLLSVTYSVSYVLYGSYFIVLIINVIFNIYMLSKIIENYCKNQNIEKLLNIKYFKCLKCLNRFISNKEIKTLSKWHSLRRLVARYLREKSRRHFQSENHKNNKSFYKLSLKNYKPDLFTKNVEMQKIKLIEEEKVVLQRQDILSPNLKALITNQEEEHKVSSTPNLNDYLNDMTGKLKIKDF